MCHRTGPTHMDYETSHSGNSNIGHNGEAFGTTLQKIRRSRCWNI